MAAQTRAMARIDDPDEAVRELIACGSHREAAGRLARDHGGALGRLCMAMLGSQAEAEEALQDALLAAHDGMASYRGEGTVRSWLYGIARRTCAKRLERRAAGERRLRLVAAGGEDDVTQPDIAIDTRRRALEVRDALSRLTPTEREALLLRYEADLSFREIGDACGVDEATARKRASRGLERLRALLPAAPR